MVHFPGLAPTPEHCTADFCLIPLGTPTASVSQEIAEVQRLLQRSGLKFSMHSAGTTVEGPWDAVMRVVGQCHAHLHERGVVRIQSDIRVGTRTDKHQTIEDKVRAVRELLAQDEDLRTSLRRIISEDSEVVKKEEGGAAEQKDVEENGAQKQVDHEVGVASVEAK